MRHFLTPRWGWTSLCSCLPTACAVGFILTPLCGWTPGFGHAFVRLTPCGLHSCAPLGLDLALLMPPHGLRRGLYSYAALRLDTWLWSCLRTAHAVWASFLRPVGSG